MVIRAAGDPSGRAPLVRHCEPLSDGLVHLKSGEDLPAVVLACGGAGAVYAVNDNMKAIMGQGYTLAAQAGLPLMDLEFVQFYPLVLVEPGLPPVMLYPSYPAQARLLNAAGEDILARHGDLYHSVGGTTCLHIKDGMLQLGSLDCPGFASAAEPDWSTLQPMAD